MSKGAQSGPQQISGPADSVGKAGEENPEGKKCGRTKEVEDQKAEAPSESAGQGEDVGQQAASGSQKAIARSGWRRVLAGFGAVIKNGPPLEGEAIFYKLPALLSRHRERAGAEE